MSQGLLSTIEIRPTHTCDKQLTLDVPDLNRYSVLRHCSELSSEIFKRVALNSRDGIITGRD